MWQGLILCAALTGAGYILTQLPGVHDLGISPLVCALLLGFVAGNLPGGTALATRARAGLQFSTRWLLRGGIVLFGLSLTWQQITALGPRILLLDEPISALDLHYQLRVMKLVRELAAERGMIALMVLHDLSIAARWSDRILVFAEGRLVADGPPAQAITPDILASVYRVAADISGPPDRLHIDLRDILDD